MNVRGYEVVAQIINHLHLFLTARESVNMSGYNSLVADFLRIVPTLWQKSA